MVLGVDNKVEAMLLVVLHNVLSIQRVVEMAKVVYGLGFSTFIVSKASGAAAQSGVPEAQKLALKRSKNFICLSDLSEVLELFSPSEVYIFVPKDYSQEEFSPLEVVEKIRGGHRVALVFGGLEPGLSRKEIELGRAVTLPHVSSDVGPVGTAAIALYEIIKAIGFQRVKDQPP